MEYSNGRGIVSHYINDEYDQKSKISLRIRLPTFKISLHQFLGRFVGLFDDGCSESFLITPIKNEVEIAPEKTILRSSETSCNWNIFVKY